LKISEKGETSMENREVKIHPVKYRTYVFVWMGLVILTGLTYTVAVGIHPAGWAIFVALAIAGTKSGLVLNYFMHLKSERLVIFKVIIPLVMAVFLVFILLTFSDVAFRGVVK
jgi:caa(3)-type oxidase subunit IV